MDFDLSDISVFSPENDVFVLVVISSLSLLGKSIFHPFTIVKFFIPGLFHSKINVNYMKLFAQESTHCFR